MVDIRHLLNPELEQSSVTSSASQPEFEVDSPRQRYTGSSESSDCNEALTQQTGRFPPVEFTQPILGRAHAQQKELQQYHQAFKLSLTRNGQGLIRDHPREIPCSSDPYFGLVGRSGFKIFEYEFTVPATRKSPQATWVVMWDYETGMVRLGPMFKACIGNSKSTIRKAFDHNADIDDICLNLTGGITSPLGAQGYWLPYACARAICTTFCYEIRYALTPLFGYSFIHDCLPPDHRGYKSYIIPPSLILQARQEKQALIEQKSGLPSPKSIEDAGIDRPQGSRALQTPGRARIRYTQPRARVRSPSSTPPVSPKTIPQGREGRIDALAATGWTTINPHTQEPRAKPVKLNANKRSRRKADGQDSAERRVKQSRRPFTLKPEHNNPGHAIVQSSAVELTSQQQQNGEQPCMSQEQAAQALLGLKNAL